MYFNKERLRLYFVGLLVIQVLLCVAHLPLMRTGWVDFRTFYTAGHMVHSGQLYDYGAEVAAQSALVGPSRYALPFMSPPYTALLFVPFSMLGFRAAYLAFFVVNLCFCGACVLIMRPYVSALRARWRPLTLLLFLSFMPLGLVLGLGQMSILLLLLYCSSFASVQSGRPFLAGLLLSLALIKFQIALPVALLFLLWRQWRFVAGFASGAVALALISIRITGVRVFLHYLPSIFSIQASSVAKYASYPEQMPNLYGFFHAINSGKWGFVATIICSLLVVIWAATCKPSLPLALLAGLLVSYHLYPYDLTLLLLPIVLVLNAELESGTQRPALYASLFMVSLALFGAMIPAAFLHLLVIPVGVLFVSLGQVGAIRSVEIATWPDRHSDVDQTAVISTT